MSHDTMLISILVLGRRRGLCQSLQRSHIRTSEVIWRRWKLRSGCWAKNCGRTFFVSQRWFVNAKVSNVPFVPSIDKIVFISIRSVRRFYFTCSCGCWKKVLSWAKLGWKPKFYEVVEDGDFYISLGAWLSLTVTVHFYVTLFSVF